MRLSFVLQLAMAQTMLCSDIPRSVFAHFMVGNSASYTQADWNNDISEAQAAHIDAFALNIGPQDSYTDSQIQNAIAAANQLDFKLFLSFDFASDGPWQADQMIPKIQTLAGSGAQFTIDNKPVVSTFEGSSSASEFQTVKATIPIFFIPDWTSVGPDNFSQYVDQVDGAFSWDAWPEGANNMTDTSDKAWMSTLGSKAFMMGVSPWFYTNLPQWNKNWLWSTDTLWHDRWLQAIELQPTLIEIITWNDYGESSYIGPIHAPGIPSGAEIYVDDMPHDHWRDLLPYYIDAYKSGVPSGAISIGQRSVSNSSSAPGNGTNGTYGTNGTNGTYGTNGTSGTNETSGTNGTDVLTMHYRPTPLSSGSFDGTTLNDPAYQQALSPSAALSDAIFITAFISSAPAQLVVTIYGNPSTTIAIQTAGLGTWQVPFNGQTGKNVTVAVVRNGKMGTVVTGTGVGGSASGKVNFNAFVGGSGAG